MPKARRVRLTVELELPQWLDSPDLDSLERELASTTAGLIKVPQRSVRADIKTLEAL